MKVLWFSNAPHCRTGYGTQTAQVCRRMQKAGYEVAISANYGLAGASMDWEGITVFPQGYSSFSTDVLAVNALRWFNGEPGLTIALYDSWVFKTKDVADLPQFAVWTPVDHSPAPPKVVHFFADSGARPIAMARDGERLLRAADLDPLYVPHGVDTNVYEPLDRIDARKHLGLPEDRFIVGMVSTNKGISPIRKNFDGAFRAFAGLKQTHSDALLYVHGECFGFHGGIDLRPLAAHYGLLEDDLIFANQATMYEGVNDSVMAALYSSFDVLLFPSLGEGFGIPAIEAQACGTPVIVTDFSAQAELVAPKAGWRIPFQLQYDALQASDLAIPLDEFLIPALLHAYETRGDDDLRRQVRLFAEQYDADKVFDDFWLPALAELEQEVPSTEPIVL